ncbi:GT4 family glycosyltransferase PelF [Trichococcus collinsii]|uniref:Glycosyltransferase involved in cell wall bisynthesis n=1 Tax=Trichococcus collinsii TaxID=157076 RepID=A0AB38A0Y4_9LACT|nr:GT4 family glycosyltransferase PelF [Trichococcus collinsii]CZQ91643.1 glycosyl transferases group 1 [Trichococcus collinsii]SEA55574.1 Glycosyltransferase involved in cell wall bisynthesis [Trichococcus collinsii]
MKICILCEGSYPYVVGGVSSWVQQLVKLFPEHEFFIYAIAADESMKGDFRYELPENIGFVQEVFLNDAYQEQPAQVQRTSKGKLQPWQVEAFTKLVMGEVEHWDSIFDFFLRQQRPVAQFLMSKEFYSITQGIYQEHHQMAVYSEFLWTMRSMYLTLFHILNNPPEQADIYHAVSTGYAGIAAALGKRKWGGKMLLTEHGIYTREREEEIIKADWVPADFKQLWIHYFKNLSKAAYMKSDRILALFDMNNALQIELGADPIKCDFIANGINVKNFSVLPQKEDSNILNVGAIIRVSPIKDIKTMLYAFDLVKQKMPQTHFYLMGPNDEDPEYYKECLELLEELGTEDVAFTGRVQVRNYIGKMDILVLSSLSEAQPLALMEAMAAGKPCVSTNVGSVRELLEGSTADTLGKCGLLAPIMNYEKIASNIIQLLENPEMAAAFGEVGKIRIEKYYSEHKFITAYRELYQSLGEGEILWQE